MMLYVYNSLDRATACGDMLAGCFLLLNNYSVNNLLLIKQGGKHWIILAASLYTTARAKVS